MDTSTDLEEFRRKWMGRNGSKKDIRDLGKELERRGWEVSATRSSHNRAKPPSPEHSIVIYAGTPSDHRYWRNAVSQLIRSGFGQEGTT